MKAVPSIQPIKDSSSGRIEAVEVLARWRFQGRFIAAGDYPGMINWSVTDREVASGVLEAIEDNRVSLKKIFLNVSEATLVDGDGFYQWLAVVQRILSTGVQVGIEVVESIPDMVLAEVWDLLKSIKVDMVMDDCGYGFSSLERLSTFPWTYCKFDVRRYGTPQWSKHDKAAMMYCKENKIVGIAECVETFTDLLHARWSGMTLQQGYLCGAPTLIEEGALSWQRG